MSGAPRTTTPKLATIAAQSSNKAVRPGFQAVNTQKNSRAFSAVTGSIGVFNILKRSSNLKTTLIASIGRQSNRAYSSEMANAMVQVSQNLGMGQAAIGLGGASIGIGMVFAALLTAVARNPSMRGQLFSYSILGFAFVEAMGLFDLMVAVMCKYV